MTLPWNTPVQGYFSPLTPNSFFGYSFSLSHILPCTEDYIFMNVYLQMDTIYNNLGFCFVVLTAPPCLALCLYIVIIHISPGLLSALSSALYHPPCSLSRPLPPFSSVQFSSIQSLSHVQLFATP